MQPVDPGAQIAPLAGGRPGPLDPSSTRTSNKSCPRHTRIVEQQAERFPEGANLLIDAAGYLLAFAAFPKEHWRENWSSNPHDD